MSKYIRYFNNSLESWAAETLTPEELVQFQSAQEANNLLWKSYREQGLYTVKDVYETVYSAVLNTNIEMTVGTQIIMTPGVELHELAQDSNYQNWVQRFQAETGNIISVVQVN